MTTISDDNEITIGSGNVFADLGLRVGRPHAVLVELRHLPSWFANQVIKGALVETDGLTLRNAYALDLFKNEGLAPDAAKRVADFLKKRRPD